MTCADRPAPCLPLDLQGWHSRHPIFAEMVNLVRPKVYVEAGVWKGCSLLHVADLTADMGTTIYACDTWLGGIDHLVNGYEFPTDACGYPRLYHQFLANVAYSPHGKRITPVIQATVDGARWLQHQKVEADLIYIDASHQYPDVLVDMHAYGGLLAPGGVMFGDDLEYHGVRRSWDEFREGRTGCREVGNNFWVYQT